MVKVDKVLQLMSAQQEVRHCPQHGPYTALLGHVRDRTVVSLCPQCLDDEQRQTATQHSHELAAAARRTRFQQRVGRAGVPPRFLNRTFANYQATSVAQRRAVQMTQSYADRFATVAADGICLLLCGRPGTGKTHLACAIANQLIQQDHLVLFRNVYTAVSQVKETYARTADQTERQVIQQFTEPDLLILDEVGVQFGTATEQLILFQLLNSRYEAGRPTVLIANLLPAEIATYLGDRLMDRLTENGGLVIGFDWASYRRQGQVRSWGATL